MADKDNSLEEAKFYINYWMEKKPEHGLMFLYKYNDILGKPAAPEDLQEHQNLQETLLKIRTASYVPIIPVSMFLAYKSPLKIGGAYRIFTGLLAGLVAAGEIESHFTKDIRAKAKVIEEKYTNLRV